GAVEAGRVGVAAAGRLAAGVGADGEGAGQGEARGGERGGDPVAGRLLVRAGLHATHRLRSTVLTSVHSIFLWTVPAREAPWSRQSMRRPRIPRGGGRRRSRRGQRRSPGTWSRRRDRRDGSGRRTCYGRPGSSPITPRRWGWSSRPGSCCTRRRRSGSPGAPRGCRVWRAARGARARTVPALDRYHARLLAAAAFAGTGLVCGGADPGRRNITNPLITALDGGTGLPRLDTSRLRATWLAGCAEQLGLATFMHAAGISCSQRRGDLVAGLEPAGEAEAVRLLGGRRR